MSLYDPAAAYAALDLERAADGDAPMSFDYTIESGKLFVVAKQWPTEALRAMIKLRRQLAKEGKLPAEVDACLLERGQIPAIRTNDTLQVLRSTKDDLAITITLNRRRAELAPPSEEERHD
jgi:hypothetical protein